MNRTLVFAIGIIIALCACLYFLAEQQKQAFDASLPKPPAVKEQQNPEETAGGHWHGDEWHAEPHADNVIAEPIDLNKNVEDMTITELAEFYKTLPELGELYSSIAGFEENLQADPELAEFYRLSAGIIQRAQRHTALMEKLNADLKAGRISYDDPAFEQARQNREEVEKRDKQLLESLKEHPARGGSNR